MSLKHDEQDKHLELNEQDGTLDKILTAVRTAVPPEGMHARITHRLQHQATTPSATPFRLGGTFANCAFVTAWWRGAMTGAAAVLLLAAASLFASHWLQTQYDRGPSAEILPARLAAASLSDSTHASPAGGTSSEPCTRPGVMRTASAAETYTSEALRAETRIERNAPSRPAPPLPLTAQERALVRLAQTSTPQQVAAINPVEYANLEAQSTLKFEKFFASPAPLPATDANASTMPIADRSADSEDKPKRDSTINPAATSEEKP